MSRGRTFSGTFEQDGESYPVTCIFVGSHDVFAGPAWFTTYRLGLELGEARWEADANSHHVTIDQSENRDWDDREPDRVVGLFTVIRPPES
jgi:hypothetical protein